MSPTPVLEIGERVVYALQPKQLRALAKTPLSGGKAVHVGYGGAAGGGKSHLARAVAALVAWLWPGSTGIIFRRTHPEVLENHIVSFRAEVPEEVDGQRIYTWRATESAAMWANGSRTLFGYLGADDDVYRYQGAQYDLMVFEEATHYTWFQVSWLVGNRLRASVPGSVPFALYPSNPGNRGHAWYKRLFIDRMDGNDAIFRRDFLAVHRRRHPAAGRAGRHHQFPGQPERRPADVAGDAIWRSGRALTTVVYPATERRNDRPARGLQ